jgi:hypothetical protein
MVKDNDHRNVLLILAGACLAGSFLSSSMNLINLIAHSHAGSTFSEQCTDRIGQFIKYYEGANFISFLPSYVTHF